MKHNDLRLGAALAYYAAFSMAPLLMLFVAVVTSFYCPGGCDGGAFEQVQAQIAKIAGSNAAEAIANVVRGAAATGTAATATVAGLIMLFLGATSVFAELQDAMNTIWEVHPPPNRLWLEIIRKRLLSFVVVVAIGFLLLASLAISAVLAAVSEYFQSVLPLTARIGPLVDVGVSIAITTVLFALIYKILPDADVAWRDVWKGAAATAVLFSIGKFAIGLYLGRTGFASAYGAAGSLLVLLAWVYYSSQILLLGAEFTRLYPKRAAFVKYQSR